MPNNALKLEHTIWVSRKVKQRVFERRTPKGGAFWCVGRFGNEVGTQDCGFGRRGNTWFCNRIDPLQVKAYRDEDKASAAMEALIAGKLAEGFTENLPVKVKRKKSPPAEPPTRFVHASQVTALAIDGTGKQLVSGHEDGSLVIWEVDTGKAARTIRKHRKAISALAITKGQRSFLSGSYDGTVREWELPRGRALRTSKLEQSAGALVLTGKTIVCSVGDRLRVGTLGGQRDLVDLGLSVYGVALSADGSLALIGDEATARLFDTRTGQKRWALSPSSRGVPAVALSPDSKRALLAERTPWLVDVRTGKVLRKLRGHTFAVHALAFTPDGRHAITVGEDNVRRWNLATGKSTVVGPSRNVPSVLAISANGRWLVTGRDGALTVLPL